MFREAVEVGASLGGGVWGGKDGGGDTRGSCHGVHGHTPFCALREGEGRRTPVYECMHVR